MPGSCPCDPHPCAGSSSPCGTATPWHLPPPPPYTFRRPVCRPVQFQHYPRSFRAKGPPVECGRPRGPVTAAARWLESKPREEPPGPQGLHRDHVGTRRKEKHLGLDSNRGVLSCSPRALDGRVASFPGRGRMGNSSGSVGRAVPVITSQLSHRERPRTIRTRAAWLLPRKPLPMDTDPGNAHRFHTSPNRILDLSVFNQ